MDHFFADGLYINLEAVIAMQRFRSSGPDTYVWTVVLIGYTENSLQVDDATGEKLIALLAKRADSSAGKYAAYPTSGVFS